MPSFVRSFTLNWQFFDQKMGINLFLPFGDNAANLTRFGFFLKILAIYYLAKLTQIVGDVLGYFEKLKVIASVDNFCPPFR